MFRIIFIKHIESKMSKGAPLRLLEHWGSAWYLPALEPAVRVKHMVAKLRQPTTLINTI